MPFRGFTEAKHNDGALNDLETRLKNTFNQVKSSRILGGSLLSGVKLKSTASTSEHVVPGVGRSIITVKDYSVISSSDVNPGFGPATINLSTNISHISSGNVVSSPLGRLNSDPITSTVTLETPADISNFSDGMEVTFSPGIGGATPHSTTTIGFVKDNPLDPDYGTFTVISTIDIEPQDYCSSPPIPTSWDWTSATSNEATAESIASAFSPSATLRGLRVVHGGSGSNEVSVVAYSGSLTGVQLIPNIWPYAESVPWGGIEMGPISPTANFNSAQSLSDEFSINEAVRFGPGTSTPSDDMFPGVFKIKDIGTGFSLTDRYLLFNSMPPSMSADSIKSGMYMYKLLRNPIPGVSSDSKYMVLNQDRPSKIWSEAGSGTLTLLCDNDCTVDLWVF